MKDLSQTFNRAPQQTRIWDKAEERMHRPEEDFHHCHIGPHGEVRLEYVADVPITDDPVIVLGEPIEDLVAMRYIGLAVNENPIYEGDIVKTRYDTVGVVEWSGEDGVGYGQPATYWIKEGEGNYCNVNAAEEIIGTVFENPDRLPDELSVG